MSVGVERIDSLFRRLTAARAGACCAYLPVGDPQAGDPATLARILVEGGAHILECGLPGGEFAHEPLSLRASLARAGARGTDLPAVLAAGAAVRAACPEVVLVLLAEPMSLATVPARDLGARCAEAGFDGVVLAGAGPGVEEMREALARHALCLPAYLPTASAHDVVAARTAGGFAALAASTALVSESGEVASRHAGTVRRLREMGLSLPVLLRLGSATAARAMAALALGADGISTTAGVLAHLRDRDGLRAYLRELSVALTPGSHGVT